MWRLYKIITSPASLETLIFNFQSIFSCLIWRKMMLCIFGFSCKAVWYYLLSQLSRLHECWGKNVDKWPPVPTVSKYLPVLSWIRFLCIQSYKAGSSECARYWPHVRTLCCRTNSNDAARRTQDWIPRRRRHGSGQSTDLYSVLGIRDILVRIRIPGSVLLDPTLFFIEFKDARKKIFFFSHFFLITCLQVHHLQSKNFC